MLSNELKYKMFLCVIYTISWLSQIKKQIFWALGGGGSKDYKYCLIVSTFSVEHTLKFWFLFV